MLAKRILPPVTRPRHSWGVDLRVLPSGRIKLCLMANACAATHVLTSPSRAMDAIESFLLSSGFESFEDELCLLIRDAHAAHTWSTRSRYSGLYWCATVLARIWPPRWTPVVERRGSKLYAGVSAWAEPPLIERRRSRASAHRRLQTPVRA